MIEVLSFDLDGTLVDTGSEICAAVNATLADFGIEPRQAVEIESLIGAGAHELMRRLVARTESLRRLDQAAVFSSFEQHYAAHAGTVAQPYPGCAVALERLRDAGIRLACVTNKEERHARRVLEATALAPHFALLVGGDTLPFKKPDARVLQHVLATLGGEPSRAAHVGDSRTDLEAARNAGVAGWAVPWGYNAGEPIAQEHPTRLFASFASIVDAVLAQGQSRVRRAVHP